MTGRLSVLLWWRESPGATPERGGKLAEQGPLPVFWWALYG